MIICHLPKTSDLYLSQSFVFDALHSNQETRQARPHTSTDPAYSNLPPHTNKQTLTHRLFQHVSLSFFPPSQHIFIFEAASKNQKGVDTRARLCVPARMCTLGSVRYCACQTWDCRRLNLIPYSLGAPPSPSLPAPSFPYPLPPRRKLLIYFA